MTTCPILARTRALPCGHGRARFRDLMPAPRRCRQCGRRWAVSFESAVGASALVGRPVWRAVWREEG